MFERDGKSSGWRRAGTPFRISLGANGLAAGAGPVRGLQPKVEGDGRTPTGTYPIVQAFGRAAHYDTRMPYLAISRAHEAVDDPASAYYNRIVDTRRIPARDWKTSENMWRGDHLYDLGAVVGYNSAPAKPGKGSCIYLHIWKSPGAPTAGCVAMPREDLEKILRWLDPATHPVISIAPARD